MTFAPRSPRTLRQVATCLLLVAAATLGYASGSEAAGSWPEELRIIGTSRDGRDIQAWRFGSGSKTVVVVGQIHGNEKSGIELSRKIAAAGAKPGYTLWLIETVNPDGNALGTRQNANGVDLNRNFPAYWKAQPCPGKYCAGPGAASEPETLATMRFIEEVRPRLVVFYHSVGNVVDAAKTGVGNYAAVRAYAKVAKLRSTAVSCGPGGCTGNATQQVFAQDRTATAFVVELPCDNYCLRASTAVRHVNAFWAAAKAA